MSDSVEKSKSEVSSWEVESLRLTVFPTPRPYSIETSWWEKLVGEPPEKKTTQPREGIIREEGPTLGGRLILVVQTARIDWVLAPTEPGLVVGNISEVLEPFLTRMYEWLPRDCPSAQRIALGMTTQLPVSDKSAGYRKLSTYLPGLTIDAENSSDLLYQINRPRASSTGAEGLRINRLSRWTVAFMQRATLSFSNEQSSASVQEERYHCRLELDVNTGADYLGEFSGEQGSVLVRELKDMGIEIIKEGDVP